MAVLWVGYSTGGDTEGMAFSGSLFHYTRGMAEYGAFTISNLMILHTAFGREDSELMLFPGLLDGVWVPSTIAGISADSKIPELASEFIESMLSTQVQSLNYGVGLPVTKTGMASQEARIAEITEGRHNSVDINTDDLISMLHTPSIYDSQIKDMIWEGIEKFLKDEIDLEGALRVVEQSIRNYLAEREN
jgi:hypothetical protein